MHDIKSQSPETLHVMSERIHEASGVLKAMASDNRLKIMCALSDGECSVSRLAELTGQSSSTMSQHLAKLRAAGLVDSRRDAQTIYYRCADGIGRALVDTLCVFYRL